MGSKPPPPSVAPWNRKSADRKPQSSGRAPAAKPSAAPSRKLAAPTPSSKGSKAALKTTAKAGWGDGPAPLRPTPPSAPPPAAFRAPWRRDPEDDEFETSEPRIRGSVRRDSVPPRSSSGRAPAPSVAPSKKRARG